MAEVVKNLYYHPESDSYTVIPPEEIAGVLNSVDGANCVEVRDVVVAVPPAPAQYAVVAKEELLNAVADCEKAMGDAPLITDQQSFDAVRAVVKDAKAVFNNIEAARTAAKAPFVEAGRRIDAAAKELTTRLNAVMNEGKLQQADFIKERDDRIAAENAARAVSEAAAHLDTSRPTPALTLMQLPDPLVAPLQNRPPRIEVFDPSLLPREYLMPDLAKIGTDALAGKLIPGVRIVQESNLVAR